MQNLIEDKNKLKKSFAFFKMKDQQLYQHLGCTSALDPVGGQLGHLAYIDFQALISGSLKNPLGFIGLLNAGLDHMVNSSLNPVEAGVGVVSYFYFLRLI